MDSQYLKGVIKYIFTAVLSVLIIGYIMYHISGGFSADIGTVSAILTTQENTLTLDAVIIRNEELVYSDVNGSVHYLYEDGEKVPVNAELAQVYGATGSEDLIRSIIEINKRIKILESSNMADSEKRTDTASTDKLIWNHIYSFTDIADSGNVASASSVSDDLLIQLNRRKIITKTVGSYNNIISELKAQVQALSSSLSSSESTVLSQNSGYFYSSVDGFERILSSSDISKVTFREFSDILGTPAEKLGYSGSGYPVGKVVTDYQWYISCPIPADQIHFFITGKYYDVKFPYNDGISINMYLSRVISSVDSDTAYLILRSDVVPSNFNYLRNQTVQVVRNAYTGYRIPVSALRIVNGQEGVYILRGSLVQFKKVKVIYDYDGYVLVQERDEEAKDKADWLYKNDYVIVKGKDLYDGKIAG